MQDNIIAMPKPLRLFVAWRTPSRPCECLGNMTNHSAQGRRRGPNVGGCPCNLRRCLRRRGRERTYLFDSPSGGRQPARKGRFANNIRFSERCNGFYMLPGTGERPPQPRLLPDNRRGLAFQGLKSNRNLAQLGRKFRICLVVITYMSQDLRAEARNSTDLDIHRWLRVFLWHEAPTIA
jgi:hypothetical protein